MDEGKERETVLLSFSLPLKNKKKNSLQGWIGLLGKGSRRDGMDSKKRVSLAWLGVDGEKSRTPVVGIRPDTSAEL